MAFIGVIRYQIDPFQKDAFKKNAENGGRIIRRCGGVWSNTFFLRKAQTT